MIAPFISTTLIASLLKRHAFTYTNEDELQHAVAEVLDQDGYMVRREVPMPGGGRVDILVTGRKAHTVSEENVLAIEVKVRGQSPDSVLRQLARYAPHVEKLMLVTNSARQKGLPVRVVRKPLVVVVLQRL